MTIKRLVVELELEIHNKIKKLAIDRNTTLKRIIIQLVLARLELEEKKLLPE
jgi:hypothetical protein